ncbi:MAG: ATP-dependent metallopeptidase FtsH/Yme1/Tma family protein [Chloroflexi bacterium]|nr:ATP-dependent metallopeptidase FtsH/Yme1/Tma family protein [Chloroflexota bacterium]
MVKPAWPKNAFVYLLILIASIALFYSFLSPSDGSREIPLSQVASLIKQGKVESLAVSNDGAIRLTVREGGRQVIYSSRKEPTVGLGETLLSLGVTPEQLGAVGELVALRPSMWENWGVILVQIVPLLLIGIFLVFMLRQAQSGNNQALSFGRSRARMVTGDRPRNTFDDVAGADEAKQELQEIVEFLKDPEKFMMLGARIPKGVLLVGPPGTGKTLMARAVAGEAGVPFFSISGSEFVEMFVGVGASRVRDLFDQAKRNSPCIVFVDEIDAVGRQRGAGLGGSHDEREQTLNQILVEMDGFDTDTKVIVLAATNRPDILDPALLRPGRFDRRVVIDRPDRLGREAILKVHTRNKPLAPDVDLSVLAKQTPGFTGADIENLVNEAAILAARRNARAISMADLQEAVERVIAGPERRSRLISDREKRIIAYHEAGHALVQMKIPECDPVHKVSIVARGMAGGYTMTLPEDDRTLYSKTKFEAEMAALLGGRAAEEIVFGDVTTGASDDLRRCTRIARAMVTEYGMSEALGPRTFGQKEELIFLGREIAEQRDYGEEIAVLIDREIKALTDRAYGRAKEILTTYRRCLDAIANALIEKETLESNELEALVKTYEPEAQKEAALAEVQGEGASS